MTYVILYYSTNLNIFVFNTKCLNFFRVGPSQTAIIRNTSFLKILIKNLIYELCIHFFPLSNDIKLITWNMKNAVEAQHIYVINK